MANIRMGVGNAKAKAAWTKTPKTNGRQRLLLEKRNVTVCYLRKWGLQYLICVIHCSFYFRSIIMFMKTQPLSELFCVGWFFQDDLSNLFHSNTSNASIGSVFWTDSLNTSSALRAWSLFFSYCGSLWGSNAFFGGGMCQKWVLLGGSSQLVSGMYISG